MTDRQLAVYLGIINTPTWPEVIAALTKAKRGIYERLAALENEIELWQQGLGPRPKGVLIDASRTPAHAQGRVQRLKNRMIHS